MGLEVVHLLSVQPLGHSCPINSLSQRCPLILALFPPWWLFDLFQHFLLYKQCRYELPHASHGPHGQAYDWSSVDMELMDDSDIGREGTVFVKDGDPVS